ncbi:MAG: MFS transporter [Gammaproteobacteria bacterium]|nr:MFS transporter [Gammaproteobacteria bacterium]
MQSAGNLDDTGSAEVAGSRGRPLVGTVSAAIDALPVLPFHRALLRRIAVGMFFDIFDLYIAAAVGGALVAAGWATLADLAPLASLTLAGMLIGGLAAGVVGDRVGRRQAFRWSLALVAVSSMATAAAPGVKALAAARFFTGLGLGAEAVLGYAAFAEFLPASMRSRWIGWLATIANTGVLAAAIAGYLLIPWVGWRALFGIAAAGALLGWWLRRDMPESPRWLEATGRRAAALVALEQMAPGHGRDAVRHAPRPVRHPAATPEEPESVAGSRDEIGTARALTLAAGMNTAMYLAIFSFLTWLPSIMVSQGRALPRSLLMNLVMSSGSLVGTFSAGYIAERLGRRTGVAALATVTAALGIAFGSAGDQGVQTALGFALYVTVYALAVASVSIYTPELLATPVRLRGAGVAVSIGRGFAMLAPLALPALLGGFGLIGVSTAFATVMLMEAGAVLLFGIETQGRPMR